MDVGPAFDSALHDLSRYIDSEIYELVGFLDLISKSDQYDVAHIIDLVQELRFVKMFFWWYANWESTGNKYGGLECFVSHYQIGDPFYYQWLKKADLLIPEIRQISLDFIRSSSLQCKSSTGHEIHEFLVTVYQNLEDLFSSRARMFVPVKGQIEVLQQKLKLFRDLVKFTAERCINHETEMEDFRIQVLDWTNRVASLLFLYWVDQNEEETVLQLKTILLYVIEIKPCTPAVKRLLLGALKASESLPSETCFMGNFVANSVDLLLEDLMDSMEDSVTTSLRDGLIILITFLRDPPMECGKDGNEILEKAEAVVDEADSLVSFLCSPDEEEGTPNERYITVVDFLEKINIFKAEIREHYVQIQDFSLLDFPRTNVLGFIDFLLGNMKKRLHSIIFAKFLILAIQEKLLSVRAYLKDLVEQQNEIQELKRLWMRITNGAYAVEHVLDRCFVGHCPIWHKMICLSILKDEIEIIMIEMQKIRHEFTNNIEVHVLEMNSKQAKTLRIDESVVGFKNEATEITDQLTRGSRDLRVVSIVGMPGQGKTTLANKVYNEPSIKYHFHKLAWCSVSQAYRLKELLLSILSDVTVLDDKMLDGQVHEMSLEDLGEILYKSLKGQRYLIVMDDIWDIMAWYQLKESFPNDKNGSRIIFTSRIRSIALQAGIGSSTHFLCPLSAEESWKLLQKRLFHEDCCPLYLSEVGMKIVEICEGLPLSIVVTAGVLARRVTDLDWWKEIEGDLSSKILGEGCRNILELSYKHLPDILKPCFLYFGMFQQGKSVNVRRLTQLWVAEGFITKVGVEKPEDVAQNFLKDLIDRSLVIVAKRSSTMGIKDCRVHDLLFDLCLAKVKQDYFLRLLKDSQYPPDIEYPEYRLSIHSKWSDFAKSNPKALCARTLHLDEKNLVDPHSEDASILGEFTFLRVLDMPKSISYLGFPTGLLSLIHLTYLAFGEVPYLPQSIENLQNLEVLQVERLLEAFVPDTIWKMKSLRHVNIHDGTEFSLGNHLPKCARLDNLDSLSCPILCRSPYGEKLLERFPKVRKLRMILNLPRERMPRHCGLKLPSTLGSLSNLESLNLYCPNGMGWRPVLEFPSTLKKLTLRESSLPWGKISAIGKLPNLQVLKLLGKSFVGEMWDVEDNQFLNLKFLKLEQLDVREWNTCTDPFPCLERLVVSGCGNLEEIPPNFGEICMLNVIEVRDSSRGAKTSAQKILNERLDLGNDGLEVLIS